MNLLRCSGIVAGVLALAVGCGGSSQPAPKGKPTAGKRPAARQATPPIATVDVAKLPKLTGGLPPLDDGRFKIDTPDGWRIAPRHKDYLIRLQLSGATYPLILIQSAPSPDLARITRKNLGEFAARRQAALDKELGGQGVELAKEVTPIQVGDFLGVEYQRRAHTEKVTLDRLFLVTVAEGRLYTLEMRALAGTLRALRPEFLAMAASIKTSSAGEAAPSAAEAP